MLLLLLLLLPSFVAMDPDAGESLTVGDDGTLEEAAGVCPAGGVVEPKLLLDCPLVEAELSVVVLFDKLDELPDTLSLGAPSSLS